ncbi:uncharacterized protein LOC132925026 [Rhopalosiphum padi]|uniref:uncharacterized protein LOC132925026 n=1 Tax=Rhopalosiphum padi TaxID=40932 RepID=UPI00298EB578|nr:uncharacterized protein LOC132925026 [Rhopalosiphum padi]
MKLYVLHVSHICPNSNESCRCQWLQRSNAWTSFGRRRLRRITRANQLQPVDYANILRYLSKASRFVHGVGGFAEDARLRDRYQHLSERRYRRSGQAGLLDGCGGALSCDIQCEQSISVQGKVSGEVDDARDTIGSKRKANSKKAVTPICEANGPLTITQLLYEYPTCPPHAYLNIKEFFNNTNLNWMYTDSKDAQRDIRNWCAKLNWWTLKDFDEYYSDPKVKPYFNAYNRIQSEVYYDVDTSVEIADKLLRHQFNNNTENINIFLTDVLNVIDKRVPKLNTIAIHAEPNAGKNYFFDPIAAFFINYGSIGTANKTNQFAFQEAAGKRLVLWNEPNYEAVHIEKLKELLAGDTTRVHVKYQGDAPLQGPPIIILTNDMLSIFGMSAFQSRIRLYHWKSAPFLRDYTIVTS